MREQQLDRILDLNINNPEWNRNPVPNIFAVSNRIIFGTDESIRLYKNDNFFAQIILRNFSNTLATQ